MRMDRKTVLLVAVASLFVSCTGQLEMAGMGGMGAMMMGGGLGGPMGGGGLGGAMGGGGLGGAMGGGAMAGIPGMGKINSLITTISAMSGGGGGGGGMMMGPMIGMMVRPVITEMISYFKMTEVAKAVLGPHAQASGRMIQYATQQGKPPASMTDMLPYMNMLVDQSKKMGIYMPDGTIKKPLSANAAAMAKVAAGTAKSSRPTLEEVRNIILKRSLIWFQSSQGPPPGAGGPPKAAPPKTGFAL